MSKTNRTHSENEEYEIDFFLLHDVMQDLYLLGVSYDSSKYFRSLCLSDPSDKMLIQIQ